MTGHRSLGLVGILLISLGCDKVTQIDVSPDPIECRTGETVDLVGKAMMKSGQASPVPLQWSLNGEVGSIKDTKLFCQKAGEGTVVAEAKGVQKSIALKVRHAIEGQWMRTGDEKAGMVVEIRPTPDGFIGEIISPMTEDADEYFVANFDMTPEAAQRIRRCTAASWAPGLRKWIDFKSAGEGRWSMRDLHKDIALIPAGGVCWENRDKTDHHGGYELEVQGSDKLLLRNTKVRGDQIWTRIGDDEGSAKEKPSEYRKVLDAWIEAQSRQDFVAYKKLYAKDFIGIKTSSSGTKEFDLSGWQEDRQAMFAKDFRVFVGDVKEDPAASAGPTLTFQQDWVSDRYADTGKKTLVLKKVGEQWLIVREEQLEATQTWPPPRARKARGQL